MAESNDSKRPMVATGPAPLLSELAAVLGAYLGEHVDGKRVAILGDGSTPLAEQLAEATGRRVHVFDPDAGRTSAAIARTRGGTGNVRHALLEGDAELGLAAFDAVIIPNLAELAESGVLDAKAAIHLAERMLAPRGFAAVAAPRGAVSIDYLQLFDAVSAHFEVVQMLGAAPFAGLTIAAFGSTDEPAVAIDSSLIDGSEEPIAYLALASHQPLRLDPYVVVQLPWADASEPEPTAAEALAATTAEHTVRELASRERQARQDADERGRTITSLSARIAELEDALSSTQKRHRAHVADREREEQAAENDRQRELDAMLDRIAELETLNDANAESASVEAAKAAAEPQAAPEPQASIRQVQAFEFQLSELRRSLGEARAETDGFRTQAALATSLDAEVQRLQEQLAKELAKAAAIATRNTHEEATAEAAQDIAALEARLRERGERVAALEADLRETERIGRELVRDRRAGWACPPTNAAKDGEVEALASRASRLEADLQSATWSLAAREQALDERAENHNDVGRLETALAAAHRDLAQLRAQIPG